MQCMDGACVGWVALQGRVVGTASPASSPAVCPRQLVRIGRWLSRTAAQALQSPRSLVMEAHWHSSRSGLRPVSRRRVTHRFLRGSGLPWCPKRELTLLTRRAAPIAPPQRPRTKSGNSAGVLCLPYLPLCDQAALGEGLEGDRASSRSLSIGSDAYPFQPYHYKKSPVLMLMLKTSAYTVQNDKKAAAGGQRRRGRGRGDHQSERGLCSPL
jgi:hypothetical protein